MLLGDLGANVIKLEHPRLGDETRAWGPPFSPMGSESTYFMSINRNKRSVAVDFKTPEGLTILHSLVKECDVLVDNFIPGQLEDLGLDDATVKRLNATIVWCSISGYGSRGPLAKQPGYAMIMEAFGGLMTCTGNPGQASVKLGVALTDILTGTHSHSAILAGLLCKQKRFLHIDTSLLASQVSAMSNIATAYLVAGAEATKLGSHHASIVPYGIFEASDGEIALAAGNPSQFTKLAMLVNREDWLDKSLFSSNANRVAHRDAFIKDLNMAMSNKPVADWLPLLRNAGIPCSKVNSLQDLFAEPQIESMNMTIHCEHSTAGKISLPGYPLKFRGYLDRVQPLPPPVLGEHTREILSESLGYSQEQITRLEEDGVIACWTKPNPV
jgi:succinate---hydroxymethylglutarate CoA-transferase